MVEQKKQEQKKRNYKTMPIGNDMVALIEFVEEKFQEQYLGVKPNRVEISNLIAKRVMENGLF